MRFVSSRNTALGTGEDGEGVGRGSDERYGTRLYASLLEIRSPCQQHMEREKYTFIAHKEIGRTRLWLSVG